MGGRVGGPALGQLESRYRPIFPAARHPRVIWGSKNLMTDLSRAQAAARECERAARQFVEFADRLTGDPGPADMAEFDTLVAREAAAISERVDAFGTLGFAVPSLEGDDQS